MSGQERNSLFVLGGLDTEGNPIGDIYELKKNYGIWEWHKFQTHLVEPLAYFSAFQAPSDQMNCF